MAWPLQAAFLARGGGPTRQAILLVVLLLVSWTLAAASLIVLALIRYFEECAVGDPHLDLRELRRQPGGDHPGARRLRRLGLRLSCSRGIRKDPCRPHTLAVGCGCDPDRPLRRAALAGARGRQGAIAAAFAPN